MEPTLIVIIFLTFLLSCVIVKTVWGGVSDSLQNRFTNKQRLAEEYSGNHQLANTLKQTYTVLSLNKRQAKWRDVMVVKVVQESTDVRSFYLTDQEHEPLPASLPGQHILVKRASSDNSNGTSRCYSLSDDCSAGHWRISVKKNSDQPQSVSRWLHEEVVAGDVLQVRGPSGAFFLNTAPDRNVVLVSAGIGITPMLPMLMESLRKSCRSIVCHLQFRDVAHMPFADSLLHLAQKHPEVAMNIWISRFPKGVAQSSRGLFHEGKFQARDLTQHPGAVACSDYYICGPEDWQGRIRRDLLSLGVPPESIRYELFQQSDLPSTANSSDKLVQHSIHFKQSRANAQFQASHPSLLACASQHNVLLESGCRTGACGSCAIKMMSGKVRYTREPQFQTQSNEILPCVCVPESDLELDV